VSRRSVFLLSLLCLVAVTGARPDGPPPSPEQEAAQRGIGWLPFTDAPFVRAQALNRPILLVVTVRWNRQAVRFVNEVLERPGIARVIRDLYVPVLVDADLRPDVRERYPGPAWPCVTILTPMGDPVYYQPEKKGAPPHRMVIEGVPPDKVEAVLRDGAAYFRLKSARGAMTDQPFRPALAAEIKEKRNFKRGVVAPEALDTVAGLLVNSADAVHGGFGRLPKFLPSTAVETCLMLNRRKKTLPLLSAAERTLRGAASLIDPVDGGMYRLAAAEDWTAPQYERLLARNAEALEAYLEGFRSTTELFYYEKASRIAGFIRGVLARADGSFAVAQSADMTSPDGGGYYRASAEERAKRRPPEVSGLSITGPSARAVRALLRHASIMEDRLSREVAMRGLAFLDAKLYTAGRGVQHAWTGEEAIGPLLLSDQVAFIAAHLEAYEQTGIKGHLETALDVGRFLRDNLRDRETGLLSDRVPLKGGPLLLQVPQFPYEDNCEAARLFARFHYLRREERADALASPASADEKDIKISVASGPSWGEVAEGILESLSSRYVAQGPGAADYALAAAEYLDGPLWVFLVGDPADRKARVLLDAAVRLDVPFFMRVVLDPEEDAAIVKDLEPRDPPALYLSQGGVTTGGTSSPLEVPGLYERLRLTASAQKPAPPVTLPPPGGAPH